MYKTKKYKSNPFNGPPTVRIKEIKTSRKELGRCDSYDQTSDMRNKQCFVVFQNFEFQHFLWVALTINTEAIYDRPFQNRTYVLLSLHAF